MKTLYCTLVRPLQEYACETWNPHIKHNSKEPPVGLLSLMIVLNYYTSCSRRFIKDDTFLFNVINGQYDIDNSNKLLFCKDKKFINYNLKKNDTQYLALNFSRTNGFISYIAFLTK